LRLPNSFFCKLLKNWQSIWSCECFDELKICKLERNKNFWQVIRGQFFAPFSKSSRVTGWVCEKIHFWQN
jgi:hypothetical protein